MSISISLMADGRWHITHHNDKDVYEILNGVDYNMGMSFVYGDPLDYAHIHRAANFFYEGNHPIRKNVLGGQIKYYPYENDANIFSYGAGYALIRIYKSKIGNFNSNESYNFFSSVCHELGHNSMAAKKGRVTYNSCDKALKESWASFVGWYLTEEYYKKHHNWPRDYITYNKMPLNDMCNQCDARLCILIHNFVFQKTNYYQNRQNWNLTIEDVDSRKYTPFFIDLVDDSNQRAREYIMNGVINIFDYPNDNIKNFPVDIMQNIAMDYNKMSSIVDYLRRYIGIYYTQKEYNDLMIVYKQAWGLN